MTRRWGTALLAVLLLLDLVVLVLGFRARGGNLPPLQRGTDATYVAPTVTASPSADATTDRITAPVLLGANASGLVLRATRGACETRFDNPAQFWVGSLDDADGLQPAEVPTLHEVLGLFVADDGTMRMSGLDEACHPATVVSSDEGATWSAAVKAEVWRYPADTQVLGVVGPAGKPAPLGCPPSQIVNLPDRRAVVSCTFSQFFLVQPGTNPVAESVSDFSSLNVTPHPDGESFYVFGTSADCVAQVATFVLGTDEPEKGDCLEGNRAPLAIATSGDRVIVQVGADLMVSDDEGDSFTLVGPAPPTATDSPTG